MGRINRTCAGAVDRTERSTARNKEEATGGRPTCRMARFLESEQRGEVAFGPSTAGPHKRRVLGGNRGEDEEGEQGRGCIGWHSVRDSPSAKPSLPSENRERMSTGGCGSSDHLASASANLVHPADSLTSSR